MFLHSLAEQAALKDGTCLSKLTLKTSPTDHTTGEAVPNLIEAVMSGRFTTLASVAKLECTLAKKHDQEGNAAANRDWGISVAEKAAIPLDLKTSAAMEAIPSVNEVQRLATEQRAMKDFSSMFSSTEHALRMDVDNSAS
jgi:hypothetical protein